MTPTASTDRALDLVVHGASGFVGRLVAAHLAQNAPVGTRIGLSGRSADRLTAVREGLGPAAADWPILVTPADDEAALAHLATSTRVVVSTVGPYARLGLPLVRACVDAGTDYADLTGEVLFVRASAAELHARAAESGARIVHSCGFDSVPSDLVTAATAATASADGEGELASATLVVVTARGGFSGGTIDSLRGQVDQVRAAPGLGRVLADPYALSPSRSQEPDLGPQSDVFAIRRGPTGGWVAPFVMAPFNTRVVRRSNALTDWSYGRGLRYSEVVSVGSSPVAPLIGLGIAGGQTALGLGLRTPVRPLLDRILPAPGTGPDEATRRAGRFRLELHATTTTGARYVGTVAAQGDPGYAATAVMVGQSGLALAVDADRLPVVGRGGGVLTPATALGEVLADRLRASGFTLEVQALPGGS